MGALSDLLERSVPVATPATPATQGADPCSVSQESQESQPGTPEIRAHLLAVAVAAGVPTATVHRLHADDVAACADQPDDTLRAYLRALDRGAVMDAGIAPPDYTQPAHCEGCGPVWLWPGVPARVTACPWCFRRKAGKALPRPQMTCGACIHYQPDLQNPAGGIGGCALGARRARWPMTLHRCDDHAPAETRSKQGDSLMVSYSVGSP